MGLGKIAKKMKRALTPKGKKGKAQSNAKRERRDAGLPLEHAPKPTAGRRDAVLGKTKKLVPKRRNADLARLGEIGEIGKGKKRDSEIPLHGWKGERPDEVQAPVKVETKAEQPTNEKELEPGRHTGRSSYEPVFEERADSESSVASATASDSDEAVEEPKEEKKASAKAEKSAQKSEAKSAEKKASAKAEKSAEKSGGSGSQDSQSDSQQTDSSTQTSSDSEFSQVDFEQSKVEDGPAQDDNQYEAEKNLSRSEVTSTSTTTTTTTSNGSQKSSKSSSTAATDSEDAAAEAKKNDQMAKLGSLGPEVQKAAKVHKDEQVALLQKTLRNKANSRGTDELGPQKTPVARDPKSANEQASGGWATLTLKRGYRNKAGMGGSKGDDDNKKGELGKMSGQATKYFLSRAMKLEGWTQELLARNLDEGRDKKREDTVLRYENGKFYFADGQLADTSDAKITNQTIAKLRDDIVNKKAFHKDVKDKLDRLEAKLVKLRELNKAQIEKAPNVSALKVAAGMAGRFIFVMNAAGKLFAGESQVGVVHHSSFLAGGAVACAGELEIAGGQLKLISNASGHYLPGPAFMWQALEQMRSMGVQLAGVKVEIVGVSSKLQALEFMRIVNPTESFYFRGESCSWFQLAPAVAYLDEVAKGKSRERNPI